MGRGARRERQQQRFCAMVIATKAEETQRFLGNKMKEGGFFESNVSKWNDLGRSSEEWREQQGRATWTTRKIHTET